MMAHHAQAPHRHSPTCCFLSDPVGHLSSACGTEIAVVPGLGTSAAGVARRSWLEVATSTLRGCFPVVGTQSVSFVHPSLDRYQIYCERQDWRTLTLCRRLLLRLSSCHGRSDPLNRTHRLHHQVWVYRGGTLVAHSCVHGIPKSNSPISPISRGLIIVASYIVS